MLTACLPSVPSTLPSSSMPSRCRVYSKVIRLPGRQRSPSCLPLFVCLFEYYGSQSLANLNRRSQQKIGLKRISAHGSLHRCQESRISNITIGSKNSNAFKLLAINPAEIEKRSHSDAAWKCLIVTDRSYWPCLLLLQDEQAGEEPVPVTRFGINGLPPLVCLAPASTESPLCGDDRQRCHYPVQKWSKSSRLLQVSIIRAEYAILAIIDQPKSLTSIL